MRLSRSLIVSLIAALAAAGCAQQPFGLVSSVASVDTVAYGDASAPNSNVAVVSSTRYVNSRPRGLFTSMASPVVSYAAAPIETYDSADPVPAKLLAYAPSVKSGPYTLDSGDRLRVVVFGQDGLTNSYLVDASGHIDMPLIGSIPARGATTEQLKTRITEKLRDGFVREPHVAVEIEAYRPFFILGEVTAPGQYPYVADMTVETAVAIAGGFGPRGVHDHVTISRTVGGRVERLSVPVTYAVHPGDTINVPERWF